MMLTDGWGFVLLTLFNVAACVLLPRLIALNGSEAIGRIKSKKFQNISESQTVQENG